MYARLDALFKTGVRQTEATDARMAIRRDDPRDERGRKHERAEDDETDNEWEDSTEVSLQAFKNVLLGLIGYAESGKNASPSASSPAPAQPERTPASPTAARAAQAYSQTYKATHPAEAPPPSPPPQPAADEAAVTLTQQEQRTIHALLQDIEKLKQRGVTTLKITPADSIVQSLRQAITKALADTTAPPV